jgi:predicted dehydrogenase
MTGRSTRRSFIKKAAVLGAVPYFLPSKVWAQSPSEKLRIAFIGTGGISGSHINEMVRLGVDCPCYCDVDSNAWGNAAGHWPDAKAYHDYRIMLEEQADNIDGVMIGVPDHHHFPATMIAMELGIHCYTQKPLTHTVWEARRLAKMAADNPHLVTQMGNQGHASDAWRTLYNYIHAGVIGKVLETHTWTDRPIWPQAMNRPEGEDPIPDNLDWDLWIGSAPMRPFKAGAYHPFVWRGWFDFGTGALGDMGCHMMDGTIWTMDPGPPSLIEPILVEGLTDEAFPARSIVKWTFRGRGDKPGFVQYWHDGGLKPEKPERVHGDWNLPSNGTVWIGTEGVLLFESSGGPISTWPRGRMQEMGEVPEILAKCPNQDHYAEWLNAIRGTDTTKARFQYAGKLTETVLLGNIAIRAGEPIMYDGKHMRIRDNDVADAMLDLPYREGWEFGR